jgi:hypothetical protein
MPIPLLEESRHTDILITRPSGVTLFQRGTAMTRHGLAEGEDPSGADRHPMVSMTTAAL